MRKLFNISKTNKADSDFNLDQVLEKNNLKYSELDFAESEVDVIKAFQSLNKSLNSDSNIIRNLRSILPQINFNPILKPVYTAILTTIVFFVFFLLKDSTDQPKFAEISVDTGEKITLHVTEDLTIYLNSESTIKIPLELKRNSKIYLDGEAYFEISQNKKTTIVADGVTFKSKDSNFHINTKNNQLVAHVSKGSVEFYNPELPKSTQFILNKNDKATYNPETNFIAVENETNINYLAWHTGIIEFNNTPMYSVVEDLAQHFKIPIKIEDTELSKQTLNAQYKNLEIDDILDIIQSQFHCQISADGSKIIIH